MKIVLPWPDSRLTPNAKRRTHWTAYSKVAAKARQDACYITYDALPCGLKEARQSFAGNDPIAYRVTFYPPDRRHRDDDGMIGSIKHARDGIADALAVNDRRFKPEYFFADPCKPGRVEVEIYPNCGKKVLAPECQESGDSAMEMNDPSGAVTPSGRDPVASKERTE